MDKKEFKDFCHIEFTKRGFKKRKKMYYLQGKDFLCGLYLQNSSYGKAYYVEYDFFAGQYKDIKTYPTIYDCDLCKRICILSKETVKGKRYMDAFIEYERYSAEELKPYFDEAFEKHIMPAVVNGKEFLLKDLEYYEASREEKKKVLEKLGMDNLE